MRPADVDEAVALAPHDPAWPEAFAAEVERLREALAGLPAEHIGSTAVAGLAAKPIIDVMVGTDDLARSERLVARLLALGYEDCGGADGRRYLRRRADRHYNVQLVEHGGELWKANLLIREHLRAHPAAARRYEEAKRAAAAAAPTLLAYSEAKRPAVERLLAEARSGR